MPNYYLRSRGPRSPFLGTIFCNLRQFCGNMQQVQKIQETSQYEQCFVMYIYVTKHTGNSKFQSLELLCYVVLHIMPYLQPHTKEPLLGSTVFRSMMSSTQKKQMTGTPQVQCDQCQHQKIGSKLFSSLSLCVLFFLFHYKSSKTLILESHISVEF